MATAISPNAELDEKLVDLVRANPMLYEKMLRTSPYESMKKKTELWKSIATSLGVETNYCIIRWKNLRDKFRRELQKSRELERKAGGAKDKGATWHLLDKMRFLERHIKYYGLHTKEIPHQETVTWNNMEAEQLIEEVLDDDPLQEAMDEQTTMAQDKSAISASSIQVVGTVVPTVGVNMKRIEALLEGLEGETRNKAEKRIVAYLCKCQLKVLGNEDIDDIII